MTNLKRILFSHFNSLNLTLFSKKCVIWTENYIFTLYELQMILKQIHKISVIGMLAVVIGIITVGPVMADKDSSDDHNKIEICHFDNEDGDFVELSMPENKAKGHAKNHVNDIIPAPEDGCPDKNNEESESVDGIDLDVLLGMFTEITIFEQEVVNLQSQIDNMNSGGNENFILRHAVDEDGSEWNPDRTTRIFFITDEEINANSVVSITIVKPINNVDLIPKCAEHIVEISTDSYLLRIDCSAVLPEGTQLNYVIMNPTL